MFFFLNGPKFFFPLFSFMYAKPFLLFILLLLIGISDKQDTMGRRIVHPFDLRTRAGRDFLTNGQDRHFDDQPSKVQRVYQDDRSSRRRTM